MKIFITFDILRRNKRVFCFKNPENDPFENHSHFHLKGHDCAAIRSNPSKTAIFAPKGYMWCGDTATQKMRRAAKYKKVRRWRLLFPYYCDLRSNACCTSKPRKRSRAKSGSAAMAAVAAAGKSGLLCRCSIKV